MSSPKPRPRNRPYDIVLWGATGFTGRLVAEHLVRTRSDGELRLALGGRSRGKLEQLRQELTAIDPAAADLPLEVADSFDTTALAAMAAKATVVCTTVGPYSKYGAPLVAACIQQSTDYCDLTGETPFIRDMIDAHHDEAEQAGARIVHCCGFDSIPSDLGVLMMQRAMQARHGVPAQQVKLGVLAAKGGFSGGTVASMLHMVEAMRHDPGLRRLMADPFALDPAGGPRPEGNEDLRGVRFDDDLDGWIAPFVMAAVNTRVVRRSHALLGRPWGDDFVYQESMRFPGDFKGRMRATAMAAGLAGFLAAMAVGPTRKLISRRLPSPGEGPSEAQREAGYFKMRLYARAMAEGRRVELTGQVQGFKDPGYGGTAIMLGEAARTLAIDPLDSKGGVITPTVAMGDALLERLRGAGMVFSVDE